MANFDNLHPVFKERLGRMMADYGLGLTSGWRSSDEQQVLRDCYVNCNCNNCNPANPAGSSNHEAEPWGEPAGLAADIHGDLAIAHAVCGDYGIHFPIRSVEPWHCQPVEIPYAYWTGFNGLTAGPENLRRTLRLGTRGQAVVELQQRLQAHGILMNVDGEFGPATETAVIDFQGRSGLDADGVVGPASWAALDAQPAVPQPTDPGPVDPIGTYRRPPTDLMVSSQGLQLIAQFEGFVGYVYTDPVGVETIGYGETRRDIIDQYRASGITQEEAYRLLHKRVDGEYALGVRRYITAPLYQSEFDALCSFAYNLGAAILDPSDCTLARLLNGGDYQSASREFGKWVNAGGRRLEGLVRRREHEASLFRSEWRTPGVIDPPIDPGFPQWPGRYLRDGDSGDDVRTFQQRLANRGAHISVDGVIGDETTSAVLSLQAEQGLVRDGVIGPDTWNAAWLAAILPAPPPPPAFPAWPGRYFRRGDVGEDVRAFQAQMISRGWSWIGDADGDLGELTDRAIRQFQREKGLIVDGVVGPSTWNAAWNASVS